MTIGTLKDCLKELVKEYFSGAAVYWAEARLVKPILPFVTLRLSGVSRAPFPITEEQDGELVKLYPSEANLTVNLFTAGNKGDALPGKTVVRSNTAVSDLAEFVNFLDSEYALSFMEGQEIALEPVGAVQDVSALLNELEYEYRAMVECSVGFIQEARGPAGISPCPGEPWKQNSSGGGSETLAALETGWTNAVEITGRHTAKIDSKGRIV